MKVLIALSVKEYQRKVGGILEEAGVDRFSVIDMVGYKRRAKNISWFASHPDSTKTSSILMFSFTTEDIANEAINRINEHNGSDNEDNFPIRAFVLDVEQFTKLI